MKRKARGNTKKEINEEKSKLKMYSISMENDAIANTTLLYTAPAEHISFH